MKILPPVFKLTDLANSYVQDSARTDIIWDV